MNSKLNQLVIIVVTLISTSCLTGNKLQIGFNNPVTQEKITVESVSYQNNKFVLKGKNFTNLTEVRMKGDGINEIAYVEQNLGTHLVISSKSPLIIVAQKLVKIIITDVNGSQTFPINIVMADGSVTASMLNDMGANNGDYLRFNGTNWEPAALVSGSNGAQYLGSWNANTNNPNLSTLSPTEGDYFIVSTDGVQNSVTFAEGDWVYFDGSNWIKIANYLDRKLALTGGILSGDLVLNSLLKLKGASNYVSLKASSSLASDLVFTLPQNYGSSGQVLTTDGSGNLNWTTISSSGGTVTSVTGNAPISVSSGTTAPVISIGKATSSVDGYLSATDWTIFNNKENLINSGASTQYFRGDKTWATLDTLVVPENSNLYFTNARAIASTLTGFSANNSAILSSDSIVQAFGKAQGQISSNITSISNKADSINVAQTITAAVLTGLSNPVASSDATNKEYVDGRTPWTVSGNKTYFNTSGGAVGIGTNSPTGILDVQGGVISTVSTAGKPINLIAQSGLSSSSSGFADGGAVNISGGAGGNPGANRGGNVNISAGAGTNGYPGGQIVLNAQPTVPVQINRSATDNYLTSNASSTVPPSHLVFSNGYNFNNQTNIIRFDVNNATPTINRLYFGAVSGQDGVNDFGGSFVWGQRTGSNSYSERMRMDARGRFGIGTIAPSYLLQVGNAADGSEARANAWNTLSDERLKRDFEIIPDALVKMLNLNGYYYYWNRGLDKERKLGLKAQEVQREFPEVVSKGADGFLSVSYNHLIAVVIEAIKEFHNAWLVDSKELQFKVSKLEEENELLKAELCSKENGKYSFCKK